MKMLNSGDLRHLKTKMGDGKTDGSKPGGMKIHGNGEDEPSLVIQLHLISQKLNYN
jgi:hypothetical protein